MSRQPTAIEKHGVKPERRKTCRFLLKPPAVTVLLPVSAFSSNSINFCDRRQQATLFTASPPFDVSLYFELMSNPVLSIVSIT